VPAALWFVYVLGRDPVFQARAETLTYSGPFVQVLFGVLPLVALALLTLARSDLRKPLRVVAPVTVALIMGVLVFATSRGQEGYLLTPLAWGALFLLSLAVASGVAKKDTGWNLLWAWAMVSLVAPYFPALFQRKLSMMLALPWAILAAIGLANELQRMDRPRRNLVAALALAVVCLTSVFWLRREFELVRLGVSKTVVHNIYLTHDEVAIVRALDESAYGEGAIAVPGVPDPAMDKQAFITDLSPILSGLAGVHTYAGHWSETPHYEARRAAVSDFYLRPMTEEQRLALLREWRVQYVVAPMPSAYGNAFPDLTGLGEVVYRGEQLSLVRVRD
jgi:arabinosyltransferase C